MNAPTCKEMREAVTAIDRISAERDRAYGGDRTPPEGWVQTRSAEEMYMQWLKEIRAGLRCAWHGRWGCKCR